MTLRLLFKLITLLGLAGMQVSILGASRARRDGLREYLYEHGNRRRAMDVAAKPTYDELRRLRAECRRQGLDCGGTR